MKHDCTILFRSIIPVSSHWNISDCDIVRDSNMIDRKDGDNTTFAHVYL